MNILKTWGILADNLRFIHDPNYYSVFFRRTNTELETNLWPEALKMYRPFLEYQTGPNKGKMIGKAHIREKDKTITFPSGAKSMFTYLEYDKHADRFYGAELSRAYFDEFQMQSEYAFHVIRSRLRSKAQFPSAMRCTMNPDQGHFVYNFVERYLDQDGFPLRELSGKTAWFLVVNGNVYTAWEKEELQKEFPGKNPKSYSYIPSTLEDNKILNDLEPDYKDTLDSLPEAKRKQMLLGCWHFTDTQCNYFDREWLHKTDTLPNDVRTVRAWDLASEEPNPNNRFPDYTASVKMSKCKNGFYYIHGCSRFRKRPGARDNEILATCEEDGRDVYVGGTIDPGAAGKFAFTEWVKKLTEEGYLVKKDPMPNNKSKVKKFEPFSAAAQNGLVYILEDSFNSREELEHFYNELEGFSDERSSANRKDDIADSCASAFNILTKERVIPEFSLGGLGKSSPTKYKTYKEGL